MKTNNKEKYQRYQSEIIKTKRVPCDLGHVIRHKYLYQNIPNIPRHEFVTFFFFNIQGVSEIRVLILTSERTRQFMKHFAKFTKVFQDFLAPNFYQTSRFV
jgi:hypothetical protein